MIQIRRSAERGHFTHGWLDTYHTFSFARYYDPQHMGYRALRVINEDRIAPGQGFGTHPHADMEIITYVLEGALAHKDNLGTGSTIHPGELQRMTAGTGITHSEFNPSPTEPVHLYQIWIEPDRDGREPSYEQKAFRADSLRDRLRLVASPDGAEGSLTIGQDARLYLAQLQESVSVGPPLAAGRHGWLQVVRGSVALNGTELTAGDGAAIPEETAVKIRAQGPAEVLLFDLP